MADEPKLTAGELLRWLIEQTDYRESLQARDRQEAVDAMLLFADDLQLSPPDFVNALAEFDSTQGTDPEDVVTMTTVHRTKGLEFDYVFIPAVEDGNMPSHLEDAVEIFDHEGEVPEQPFSPLVESERRLFYVAITRAKKHLYLGTTKPPTRGLQDNSRSARPSPYLAEMQRDYTKTLAEIVRQTAAREDLTGGPDGIQRSLLREARSVPKHLWEAVAEGYIRPHCAGETLPHSWQALVDDAPVKPFSSSLVYPEKVETEVSHAREEEPEWENPWAHLDEDE